MLDKSYVGMLNCWLCGEGAEILLDTSLRNTLSMNMGSSPNIICSKCESMAEDGKAIWLISIRNGEAPVEGENFNPYRTGAMVLITKEAIKRIFRETLTNPEHAINLVEKNIYFYLQDEMWDAFGLPRTNSENA